MTTCQKCGRQFVDLPEGIKGCVVHNSKDPMSVMDRIEIGYYKNTKPYKLDEAGLLAVHTTDAERKAVRQAYHNEEARINAEFMNDLFEEHGVLENPKRVKCFELAWDQGHSSGYSEIAIYFEQFVDLIK